MSELAKAGLDQVVDLADKTVDAAITALEATVDTAEVAVQSTITVGEKSIDVVLEELRTLKAALRDNLKRTANAVADAIPTP